MGKYSKDSDKGPKYKLRVLMSPDGMWKIEYPPELNKVPLMIFYDMSMKYIKAHPTNTADLETLKILVRNYTEFIKDKVIGLKSSINEIECIADICWDEVKKGI